MFEGEIVSINIAAAAGDRMVAVDRVTAVPGRGLEGDRYFSGTGAYSAKAGPVREVTLIEEEAVEALARDHGYSIVPADLRRNLVTRGVPLTHLVGKTFQAGGAVLLGVQLCEPCQRIAEMTDRRMLTWLLHRGGLNAQVLTGGVIRAGDAVRPRT